MISFKSYIVMVVFLVFCFSVAFGKYADPFHFTGISVGLTHETKSTCITHSPRCSSELSFDKITDGFDISPSDHMKTLEKRS